ncbi:MULTISPECIES: hypothetical protein [Burkholderia cepacia complex]|nr:MULTISPECIES: hypothetical protein [Burkholderia cepacia complex]MDN7479972.1 hypothetical protein [Burkholderia orbicola]
MKKRFTDEQVDVRYTRTSVEIFHRGQRIAAHEPIRMFVCEA